MGTAENEASVRHTPGPWECDRDGFVRDSEGRVIAQMGSVGDPDEAVSNGFLVETAPDLLALARRVAEHFEYTDAPLGEAARAALAKAEADHAS